jgi:hypothetical protein
LEILVIIEDIVGEVGGDGNSRAGSVQSRLRSSAVQIAGPAVDLRGSPTDQGGSNRRQGDQDAYHRSEGSLILPVHLYTCTTLPSIIADF